MSFVDNFWGTEDITAGFQVLCGHVRKGRKECEDVIDFIKERASIEEEYSKKLLKLSKSADGKAGFGVAIGDDELKTTLRTAWTQIRDSTEKLSVRHKQFSDDIYNQLHQPLLNLKEAQRRMVTDITSNVDASIKEFVQMRTNVPKLKKVYETKCKESVATQEELTQANAAKNEKKITNLNQKIAKLKKEIELSDTSYKQAVVRLDETRIKWEEEMANCCVSFENFELTRINKLREHLTEYIVLEDKLHSQHHKEVIEPTQVYIECIKADIDLELFVSEKRTGYGRPGPTFYENFETGLLKDFVFGVDLETHLNGTGRMVPEIIELCITRIEKKGLEDEGLYRLSGRQSKVNQLRKDYDKNKASVNLDDPEIHTNDVASLLKLYIRELPKPILTFTLYDQFIESAKASDEERLSQLKTLVQSLPAANKATLHFLLTHLKKVTDKSEKNKMGIPNIAIVFAPGLLKSENESNSLRDFRQQSKVIESLLEHFSEIFDE